ALERLHERLQLLRWLRRLHLRRGRSGSGRRGGGRSGGGRSGRGRLGGGRGGRSGSGCGGGVSSGSGGGSGRSGRLRRLRRRRACRSQQDGCDREMGLGHWEPPPGPMENGKVTPSGVMSKGFKGLAVDHPLTAPDVRPLMNSFWRKK